MMTAITRAVSPAMNRCELTFLPRQEIDIGKAQEQHRNYEECLRRLGVRVVSLPAEADMPDAVFVEDPAVVVDQVAVITRMGAASRRKEAESLAAALAAYRPVVWMVAPATLEGGDVMRIGSTLFVGRSERTNAEGVRQLRELVGGFGYAVEEVEVRGCMHLKTACSNLGEDRILANGAWIDTAPLSGLQIWEVPAEEPWGANILVVGETVLLPASAPRTRRMLERRGLRVEVLDIGELMKAEAGLTCLSILFPSSHVKEFPPAADEAR
jgi:dimethylargininase